MFNFLNSSVLLAAAAAVVPLIIHLFFRRKVKVVEFSSLKHLKAMQRRQVRRLKIRQLLLLLLRMLIIFVVVLAFARPTTEGGRVGSHASVSAVVLFDNSASMNRYVADGNLYDLAVKRTRELLDTFGEADEVYLIPLAASDDADETPAFTSAAVAHEKLTRLAVSSRAANLETSLDNAVNVLEQAVNLNKEIYFISDRQRHNLPDTALLAGTAANVYFVDLPTEENDNCGLTGVDFGGQLILPGHDFVITARVKNYGAGDREDLIASLFLDDNRVAQTDFAVKAGEETSVKFTRAVSTTGFHSGYVEISDDKFVGDNRYYFSFGIPERFNLLIVDGDRTGGLIALAMAPSSDIAQYWSVKQASPDNLAGVNFSDYDVVMITGAPDLADTYMQRLKAFVSNGKALFVSYDAQTDTGYYNRNYSELTGVVYDAPLNPNFSRAGYYSLMSFEVDHPVFSVFGFENNQPPQVKFYTLPTIHLRPDTRTILRFTGDRPALVETTFGSGRVLTFTGPLSPVYTDLTGQAFFVPFVSRIAEYLASDLSSYDLRLYCDANISRSLSAKTTVSAALDLITPDSSYFELSPEEQQGTLVLRVKPTDRPGIYHIGYAGREIDRFAVNLDPAECDLAVVDTDQLARALGTDKVNVLGDRTELAATISQFRYGKELWTLFLWLAVILIIVEILLARGTNPEET